MNSLQEILGTIKKINTLKTRLSFYVAAQQNTRLLQLEQVKHLFSNFIERTKVEFNKEIDLLKKDESFEKSNEIDKAIQELDELTATLEIYMESEVKEISFKVEQTISTPKEQFTLGERIINLLDSEADKNFRVADIFEELPDANRDSVRSTLTRLLSEKKIRKDEKFYTSIHSNPPI